MGKLDRLIDDLERVSKNGHSVLSSKEYTDKPLVFTAAQMKSFTPDRLTELRRKFRVSGIFTADPVAFYKQAKFMADFEDTCSEKAEFSSSFPSYAAMNDAQLRTYFTWRTKLRHGELEKTSLSYAYVYIFELLNLIGVHGADDAFMTMHKFFADYSVLDPGVLTYRDRWLTDFAVFYNLENRFCLLQSTDTLTKNGRMLENISDYSDKEILEAAESFSSYAVTHSSAYKKHPTLYDKVLGAVIRDLDENFSDSGGVVGHYCAQKKQSFFMFASAVVCGKDEHENTSVTLPDGTVYTCVNSHWLKTTFVKDSSRSSQLGMILRTVDIILRGRLNVGGKLKPSQLDRKTIDKLNSIVDGVFDDIKRKKAEKRRESIKIDMSHLDTIRRSSDITGEKLMTEEERDFSVPPEPIVDKIENHEEISAPEKTDEDLSVKILRCLLDGGDPTPIAKNAGVMLSLICDEINEKYFDDFGDSIIDCMGDTPVLIDDYKDELRGMLK